MNTNMKNFIGLSAVLTGFSADILSPSLDPIDVKSEYLSCFIQKVAMESGNPTLVSDILQKFSDLNSKKLDDQAIGLAMLDDNNGKDFVLACRKLIFMWYSGAWPTLLEATVPASTVSDMISGKTYTAGLVWQVMQSHPMGDSNDHYGYWTKVPVPLGDYTGN